MRKAVVFVGIFIGALLGFFTAFHEDLAVKIVMMCVGAIPGFAVGGAIAGIGKKGKPLEFDDDTLAGLGMTSDDLMQNYWRDKGRVPFSSPMEPEHGTHQFDADKF